MNAASAAGRREAGGKGKRPITLDLKAARPPSLPGALGGGSGQATNVPTALRLDHFDESS